MYRFRNVTQPVRLFAAVSLGERRDDVLIDPVCRMAVDSLRWHPRTRRRGYHFCSLECAGRFAASPQLYLSGGSPPHRGRIETYRREASRYDRRTRPVEPYRRQAVERVKLTRGATVIDAARGAPGLVIASTELPLSPR